MKYLYRILRLFFCPHKFRKTQTFDSYWENSPEPYKSTHVLQCNYCGKMKNHEIKV